MFSILNEIYDNSHFRTTTVILASIGTACGLYILTGITGYLSYGDNITGNIVSMCKLSRYCSGSRRSFEQILQRLHRQSDGSPLSSWSCFHTHFKYTRAVRQSTHVLTGDLGVGLPSRSLHHPEIHCLTQLIHPINHPPR